MPRYNPGWRNEKFLQSLEAAAATLGAKWNRRFLVYGIFDPTQNDPEGRYAEGLPIYVGLTSLISSRMRDHFVKAESPRKRHGCVREHLARILEQQVVPVFVILGCYDTRLEMLKAETMWAQKLHHEGYKLANCHKDQCSRMQTKKLIAALNAKVRLISIDEAIAGGVVVMASCPSCGHQRALDLQEKANELTTEASLLKGPTMARLLSAPTLCEACGEQMTYEVDDHVDPDILVPDFRIPRKLSRAKRKEAITSEQIEPTRLGQTDDQGRDLAPC